MKGADIKMNKKSTYKDIELTHSNECGLFLI